MSHMHRHSKSEYSDHCSRLIFAPAQARQGAEERGGVITLVINFGWEQRFLSSGGRRFLALDGGRRRSAQQSQVPRGPQAAALVRAVARE